VLRRLIARLRSVLARCQSERASPREIAWAVFVGVFAGCTPAVGFHGWLAVGLATLLKLNRLWAFIGSRVSNALILPFIVLAEVGAGHFLHTGQTIAIPRGEILARAPELLLDWILGAIPVGGALAIVLGAIAYAIAAWRLRRRRARDPRPSSGSPASGSPDPPP
jgi:uncharacterized protein (DUF2062 family)